MLQRVKECHREFQSFTKCYRVLQSVTVCYRVLQSVAECYRVLQSVTKCYRVLKSVTVCYRVFQSITECYRVLQSISSASTWTNFWACFHVVALNDKNEDLQRCTQSNSEPVEGRCIPACGAEFIFILYDISLDTSMTISVMMNINLI